jgi:aminoglycoside phosphotransferase (APT) family kinase protein
MLKSFLLENWTVFTESELPSSIEAVPITSCTKDYGNDVVLIFINNYPYPQYIMKISRSPLYGLKLKNEYLALKSLQKVKSLNYYVPFPYYCGSLGGNIFFIQGGIAGTSLWRLIKKKKSIDAWKLLIDESIDLLIAINSLGFSLHKLPSEGKKDGCFLTRYENELIDSGLSIKKIEELKEYWEEFEKQGHRFFLHGDYWPANIIVDERGRRINGVIDWEFSKERASAPTDIIWFMINLGYCLYLRTNPESDLLGSFRWSFFTPGRHSEMLSSIFSRYITAIGWKQDLLRILLETALVEMSVRKLVAYGRHFDMDKICLQMLHYAIANEGSICIR